jgi:hypothetical protein
MYRIDVESTDIGLAQYRDALDTYAQCKKTGVWPAYPDSNVIEEISLPRWFIAQHEQQQINNFTFTE